MNLKNVLTFVVDKLFEKDIITFSCLFVKICSVGKISKYKG